MTPPAPAVTEILQRVREGDGQAFRDLIQLAYERLEAVARSQRLQLNATMSTHEILCEAVTRLLESSQPLQFAQDRNQLFFAFARAMRQAVYEHWRQKRVLKRGGGFQRRILDDVGERIEQVSQLDMLALHEALDALARHHPRAALVVELRYFGGLTMPEIVDHLRQPASVIPESRSSDSSEPDPVVSELIAPASLPTLERDYRFALAWMRSFLEADR